MKVLIVDDSQIVVQKITEIIADIKNVQIIGNAINTTQGIEKFRSFRPHLVILDLQLKNSNGIELLKLIKAESPNTHVMVLTNYSDSYNRVACINAGADFFFDKSRDFEMITTVCEKLVNKFSQG